MGWGAVIGAVVGGAISYAGTQSQIRDNNKKWQFSMEQNATAAYADADAAIKAGEAEAAAVWGQANAEAGAITGEAEAQATAFIGQAEIERNVLYQAAEEARGLAYQNIDKMKVEAAESLRRLEADQVTWEEKAKARAAASGVRQDADTSTGIYLEGMEKENDRQYGWLKKSYDTGIAVAASTAESESRMTQRQGDAALEAGKIRANAAQEAAGYRANALLEGAGFVSEATLSSASYYAESMRQKGDSYLAPVKAKQKGREQVLAEWSAANEQRMEYGGK